MGAIRARGLQAPYLLTVIFPQSILGWALLDEQNCKMRLRGWAAGRVLPGWGDSEVLGLGRGQVRVHGIHEISLEMIASQLPAPSRE